MNSLSLPTVLRRTGLPDRSSALPVFLPISELVLELNIWIVTFAREPFRMFININKKKLYLPWHIRRVARATYWADRAIFILPVELNASSNLETR